MSSQGVGHDWSDLENKHTSRYILVLHLFFNDWGDKRNASLDILFLT